MADFAKIVRATDGAQVLFYKGANDQGDPCLFQMTEIEGLNGDLNMSFKDGDWDALDRAFDNADVKQADAVRAQFKKLVEQANG